MTRIRLNRTQMIPSLTQILMNLIPPHSIPNRSIPSRTQILMNLIPNCLNPTPMIPNRTPLTLSNQTLMNRPRIRRTPHRNSKYQPNKRSD